MRYSELFSHSLNLFEDRSKALDLQMLMEAAFNLTRTEFWIKKNEKITDKAALQKFYRYRKRLLRKEPTAYILGKKEFYGETFYIDKSALIPRPETEILVEHAIRSIKRPSEVLDIGAGSGIISILLAKHTEAAITAVENSRKALRVLKKNIALHKVGDRVTPLGADLFPLPGKKFYMIVSNPPYVSESEWRELDPTVRDYEPKIALTAGEDGLAIIRQIIESSPLYLEPWGKLLIEIGYNQKKQVKNILAETGFSSIDFFNDYSDIPRVAFGELAK